MVDLNEFEGVMISEDGYLIVRVKASETPRRSASGKSNVLFSTRGNIAMPDGSKVGINWYKPA